MASKQSGVSPISRQQWDDLSKRYEAHSLAQSGHVDHLQRLLQLPPASGAVALGGRRGLESSGCATEKQHCVLVPKYILLGKKRQRGAVDDVLAAAAAAARDGNGAPEMNGVVADAPDAPYEGSAPWGDRTGAPPLSAPLHTTRGGGQHDPLPLDVFAWAELPCWVHSDDVDRASEASINELIEETRRLRKRQKTVHEDELAPSADIDSLLIGVEMHKNRKRKRQHRVAPGDFLHLPSVQGVNATRYVFFGSDVQPKRSDFAPSTTFQLLTEEDELAAETEAAAGKASTGTPSATTSPSSNGDVQEAKRQKKSQGLSRKAREKLLKEEEKTRKRAWKKIFKSEMPRMSRKISSIRTAAIASGKKQSQMCQKEVKKRALKTSKIQKEANNRGRKLAREMLAYWRKFDRDERDRQKAEQKAELERLKMEEEVREAKRQQKKLNFLLTQTELFAHFIGKKVGVDVDAEGEGTGGDAMAVESDAPASDDVDVEGDEEETEEEMRARAQAESDQRLAEIRKETAAFDADSERARAEAARKHAAAMEQEEGTSRLDMITSVNHTAEGLDSIAQPTIFRGKLKPYQLKGLNWLANLYEQGINGILADEMGLGKTVQSISLLAHLAECKGIWGPFLIVTPTSTLHNWQRELAQFCPSLKVIPYWGKQAERKIIRKYWNPKALYRKDSAFHVLITSYNIVTMDEKYFKRLKWQYMILDEAQAVKSAHSQRWKILLGFNCRNRLLLTGTPIQNNMAELWALLHFIMPKFFDSHQEFNEWFSRGIESHATEKGQKHRGLGAAITDQQIQRLHMILKPFMMRRIKKDVETEIADKVELTIYCELTQRQRRYYQGIKRNISISELLSSKSASSDGVVKRLMNLVMQFRKVCNHPDIFERRETDSPLWWVDPYALNPHRNPLAMHVPRAFLAFERDWKCAENVSIIKKSNRLDPCLYLEQGSRAPTRGAWESSPLPTLARLLDLSPAMMDSLHTQQSLDAAYALFEHNRERAPIRRLRRAVYGEERPHTGMLLVTTRHTSTVLDRFIRRSPFEPLHRDDHLLTVVKTTFFQRPKVTAIAPTPYISQRSFFDHVIAAREEPYSKLPLLDATTSEGSHVTALPQAPTALLSPLFDRVSLSYITVPDLHRLLCDCGKLRTLDNLLMKLKAEGHRCLIYSQMTRMIDVLEEFLTYRQHRYIRLDGSSKLEDRRDMVEDWQTQPDIFCFLLSTRAGGLGINLTAADTVIFYDSDWNPTMDAQAMDRAHRLGQTKQVTVYRLITRNTIEERILNRAQEKHEIQTIVMKGGKFKPDQFQPQEVVSLLLDDAEVEEQLLRRRAQGAKGK